MDHTNGYQHENGAVFEDTTTSMGTYQGQVLQGMLALREENLLCDFTLVAGDCHFRAHKALLASVCEYFRAVFRSGMIETQQGRMELKGVSSVGLQGVLDFIYTGRLRLDGDVVMEVFKAANHLQLVPVVSICTKYLVKNLNLDNVKDVQSIADGYNLEHLKEAIHKFLIQNISKFSRTNYFKQLPLNEVCKLLKDNCLSVSSEFKVIKMAFEWVKYHRETRESLIGNLMKNIRLGLLSLEELKCLAQVPYIRKNRHCQELIRTALHFMTHPDEQVMLMSPLTQMRCEPKPVAFSCREQRPMNTSILHNNHWFPLDKAIAQPRPFINAAATVCNEFLYVCGGQGIRASTSSCLCFNPYTYKWTTIAPMIRPRKNFALVSNGLSLYAIGGICKNYEVTDETEVYSIQQNKWVPSFRTKVKIADLAACALSDKIYIAGGVDEHCFHVNDFAVFDVSSQTLLPGPDMLEIKFKPSMFAIKERLYLMDLYQTEGTSAHLELYDPNIQQWSRVQLPGVHFSRCFSAVGICDWIYFIGRNDVEEGGSKRYNTGTGEIEDIRAFPWEIESPLCVPLKLPNKFTRQALEKAPDFE